VTRHKIALGLSLVVAIGNFVAILVVAGEPGLLPVGQPAWQVVVVRLWPALGVVAAAVLPVLTAILALRDYRRGLRWQATVAAVCAAGNVFLSTTAHLLGSSAP